LHFEVFVFGFLVFKLNKTQIAMKRILLVSIGILLGYSAIAQPALSFNYQAAIRNPDGSILANQPATVFVEILSGTTDGPAVFTETHNTTTSSMGIVNLNIGSINDLGVVDWSTDQYFLKITFNGIVLGVVQLLSVPYALHSQTAETITGGITETDPLFTAWDKDYNDLVNLPTIPTVPDNLSAFNNDVGFLTSFAESQILTISNDTIYLTGGSFVKIPLTYPSNLFQGSSIISHDEQIMLNNWIGNPFQKWTMCYSKTTNGALSETFHDLCNNRGPSVTIIKLDNGFIFGGYNDYSWTSNSTYNTGNGFIFSITNQKRYPVIDNSKATYHDVSYGPTFGSGHDFIVGSDMDLNYCNFPHAYSRDGITSDPSDEACQELAGINRLSASQIAEIEVWILK
jgi:hypothetical protein